MFWSYTNLNTQPWVPKVIINTDKHMFIFEPAHVSLALCYAGMLQRGMCSEKTLGFAFLVSILRVVCSFSVIKMMPKIVVVLARFAYYCQITMELVSFCERPIHADRCVHQNYKKLF